MLNLRLFPIMDADGESTGAGQTAEGADTQPTATKDNQPDGVKTGDDLEARAPQIAIKTQAQSDEFQKEFDLYCKYSVKVPLCKVFDVLFYLLI